ncbi:MFS transporter [Noviherbaspirillum pedocola]|uniref:MFS transporter n=1 Tax=Noviherbaspirillum pedocola TaxID=2801341 RepID=UPI0038990AFB
MRFPAFAARQSGTSAAAGASRSRVLWLACVAHALHDGYTDLIYVLLPVWQADFGLDYAALALLRGVYVGTMASLQMLAGRLARTLGNRMTLALGTLLAAAGYALAGMSGGLVGLGAALAIAGAGSSTQHPLASSAVSKSFGRDARGPLSVYNFSGDIGKAALPAAIALLVTLMPWRHALWVVSLAGCGVAAALALLMPSIPRGEAVEARTHDAAGQGSGKGFALLLTTGVLDSAVRMGLLTLLPFLLKEKGASLTMVGTALSLVFIGGAAGKFACGWLGARIGVIGTTLATETGTAVCILAVLLCPLTPAMALLPLLGVMLNGTSSALYGTVPELARAGHTERAFATFYTGTIGSGALAPVVYGFLGDRIGVHGAVVATALTALTIVPLALALRPLLPQQR